MFNFITLTIHFPHLGILFIYDCWEGQRDFVTWFRLFFTQPRNWNFANSGRAVSIEAGTLISDHQRIYTSDIRDSTPLRLPNICPPKTSPCSVCSILQLPDCLTEQAAGEVGWANVWKTQGGAVPSITDIYSLVTIICTTSPRRHTGYNN